MRGRFEDTGPAAFATCRGRRYSGFAAIRLEIAQLDNALPRTAHSHTAAKSSPADPASQTRGGPRRQASQSQQAVRARSISFTTTIGVGWDQRALALVQKQLVVRASRLHMQPGRTHHKNAEFISDRYLGSTGPPIQSLLWLVGWRSPEASLSHTRVSIVRLLRPPKGFPGPS